MAKSYPLKQASGMSHYCSLVNINPSRVQQAKTSKVPLFPSVLLPYILSASVPPLAFPLLAFLLLQVVCVTQSTEHAN